MMLSEKLDNRYHAILGLYRTTPGNKSEELKEEKAALKTEVYEIGRYLGKPDQRIEADLNKPKDQAMLEQSLVRVLNEYMNERSLEYSTPQVLGDYLDKAEGYAQKLNIPADTMDKIVSDVSRAVTNEREQGEIFIRRTLAHHLNA